MAVRPQRKRAHDAPVIRLSAVERADMARTAKRQGFASLTDYLRHLHAHAEREAPAKYFIRLLTAPGDHVLDPFSGSRVAGAVAGRLG